MSNLLSWVKRPKWDRTFVARGATGQFIEYSTKDWCIDMSGYFRLATLFRLSRCPDSKIEHGDDVADWLYLDEASSREVALAYQDTYGVSVSFMAVERLQLFWEHLWREGVRGGSHKTQTSVSVIRVTA
jgi:hypothetical protein